MQDKHMMWPMGKPIIRKGTLPTPEDPAPSNQVIREYPNGMAVITCGNPTKKVLREYEEAIKQHPKSAELRLEYGRSLGVAGNTDAALRALKEAVALQPASHFAHGALAGLLKQRGELDDAIAEYEEELRLLAEQGGLNQEQGEAIVRWGLAEALRQKGMIEEAREQLQKAVAVQTEALSRRVASAQLLRQLRAALKACK